MRIKEDDFILSSLSITKQFLKDNPQIITRANKENISRRY